MFSQRNDPYCDLLQLVLQRYKLFRNYGMIIRKIMYFCGNHDKKIL